MNTIEEIRYSITEHIPEILQQFNAATEVEPWTRLPPDHRVVFLGELIALVTDLALRGSGDEGSAVKSFRRRRVMERHAGSRT